MSTSIGHTFLYNLIILFIIIIFAFLAGTLSYYKAFKVNNSIVYIIEKYEGYNEFAKTEIEALLSNLGYSVESPKCKTDYKEMYLVDNFEYNYKYCVYIEEENPAKDQYFTYGVLTYMQIDLPLINMLNIPIFTRTNQIYKFTSTKPL